MKFVDLMFTDRFPHLDLHGYDRESARVLINDFIDDNIKMGNEIIVIVHGLGSGIIRKVTWEVLKQNKNVVDYKSDYNNRGATIVQIKP